MSARRGLLGGNQPPATSLPPYLYITASRAIFPHSTPKNHPFVVMESDKPGHMEVWHRSRRYATLDAREPGSGRV